MLQFVKERERRVKPHVILRHVVPQSDYALLSSADYTGNVDSGCGGLD